MITPHVDSGDSRRLRIATLEHKNAQFKKKLEWMKFRLTYAQISSDSVRRFYVTFDEHLEEKNLMEARYDAAFQKVLDRGNMTPGEAAEARDQMLADTFPEMYKRLCELRSSKEGVATANSIPDSQCVICLDRPTTMTCLPCGHQCLCNGEECVDGVLCGERCPMCNAYYDTLMDAERASEHLHRLGERVYQS